MLCNKPQCALQDWLSATSGWAGLVVAIFAAYYVYHQLSEQRKQTAFLIGDGTPTIEVFLCSMHGQRAIFRIVNWNRRVFSIRRIKIEIPGFITKPPVRLVFFEPNSEAPVEKLPAPIRPNGYLKEVHAANGWLDRQAAPHVLDFEIHFEDGDEDFSELLKHATVADRARVHVSCHYEDGLGKSETLSISLEALDFLPNSIKRSDFDMAE